MNFFREAFSENGAASSSRLMMAYHALVGSSWVSYVVWKNHAVPDAVTLAGITAFVTAPYAVNALKGAVTAFAPKPNGGSPSANTPATG